MKEMLTNEKLLENVRKGDHEAFEELYFRMRNKVLGFAYKFIGNTEEAKELTQEIFVKFWENRENIIPTKSPEALFYVMICHCVLDKFKRKLRYETFISTQNQTTHLVESMEDYINFREFNNILTRIIDKLPTQAQKVYKLSREEGLSHQEIADQLKISKNTVSNHIKKSIRKIRFHFNQSYCEITSFTLLFILIY